MYMHMYISRTVCFFVGNVGNGSAAVPCVLSCSYPWNSALSQWYQVLGYNCTGITTEYDGLATGPTYMYMHMSMYHDGTGFAAWCGRSWVAVLVWRRDEVSCSQKSQICKSVLRMLRCRPTRQKGIGPQLYTAADDLELGDCIRLLREADGKAVNWRHPRKGLTVLQVACESKCMVRLSPTQRSQALKLIDSLLEAKANPDACGRSACTPLILCAANGEVETCNMLLKAGANPNRQSRNAFDTNGWWSNIMSDDTYYEAASTAARQAGLEFIRTHRGRFGEVAEGLLDKRRATLAARSGAQTVT